MAFTQHDSTTRLGCLFLGLVVFLLNQECVQGVVSVGFGPCRYRSTLMDDFSLDRYLGKWYQQKLLSNLDLTYFVASCTRCPQQRLQYNNKTNTVHVYNSVLVNVGFSEISYSVKGTATPVPGEVGKLEVTLEVFPGILVQSPLYILSTDYLSYSIAWSCREVLGGAINIQSGFILSRHPHVDAQYNNAIYNETAQLGFRLENFVQMNQHGCL
ncbi:hypothetical protein WDU94_013541 [Cyamophila willieti]